MNITLDGQTHACNAGRVFLVVALVCIMAAVSLSSCLRVKDSPAPGCVRYIGIAPMGGCFGRTVILNLEAEPAIQCLSISANNCNGGVLNVRNGCDKPFVLRGGAVEVEAGNSANLDVAEGNEGWQLVVVHSNFSDYAPAQDQHIEVRGALGEREISISFDKTAPLCDEP